METVGISLAQIVLGVLAVALAAAGAILQRGTRACVLASFAAALASVALTVVYFKCEAETGDLAAKSVAIAWNEAAQCDIADIEVEVQDADQ